MYIHFVILRFQKHPLEKHLQQYDFGITEFYTHSFQGASSVDLLTHSDQVWQKISFRCKVLDCRDNPLR